MILGLALVLGSLTEQRIKYLLKVVKNINTIQFIKVLTINDYVLIHLSKYRRGDVPLRYSFIIE